MALEVKETKRRAHDVERTGETLDEGIAAGGAGSAQEVKGETTTGVGSAGSDF